MLAEFPVFVHKDVFWSGEADTLFPSRDTKLFKAVTASIVENTAYLLLP